MDTKINLSVGLRPNTCHELARGRLAVLEKQMLVDQSVAGKTRVKELKKQIEAKIAA